MNPGPLATWIAAALGGGTLGTVASGWLNRRKTRAEATRTTAEAVKVEAEARKIEADADATRTETAEHLVAMLRVELDRQAAELSRLRVELAEVRTATEECGRHRAADRAELAEVKASNAGLRARIDELEHDLHRQARTTTGDAK